MEIPRGKTGVGGLGLNIQKYEGYVILKRRANWVKRYAKIEN
jgi:hypothetical protein